VTADSIALIETFRDNCTASGYTEQRRVGLVRHHDPSIRFTNSTISVLKAHLDAPVKERVFLVQPAIRLRNLAYWQEHGHMSGFGCYFIALGTLSPPELIADVHAESADLLVNGLGIRPSRVLLRCSSADVDLCQAAARYGLQVEIDGYAPVRYRHVFGIDGVTGRNTNLAIITRQGPMDVANVIIIERRGQPIAVESAYGVNMVLAQRDQLAHPVLASVGAAALSYGVTSFISLDALGAAVGLLGEGLRPVARGRGGKLRTFLKLLATDDALSGGAVREAVGAVAEADRSIREHVSPPASGLFEESSPRDIVEAVVRGMSTVAATA
jgi:hypothetical protein